MTTKVKLKIGIGTLNPAGIPVYMEAGSVQEFSDESAQRLIELQKAVPVDEETSREKKVRERAKTDPQPAKKRRPGRPKGSKNKPPAENQAVPEIPPAVTDEAGNVVAALVPDEED